MPAIIGITADQKVGHRPHYPDPLTQDLLPHNYVQAVVEAGGLPLVLPVGEEDLVASYADLLDGLILTGGYDLSPQLYGEEAQASLKATHWGRDRSEIAIAQAIIDQHKPVLGICRGLQLLNVMFEGGSLYQDLADHPTAHLKHVQESSLKTPIHAVDLEEGSYLAELLGTKIEINSLHHQAIKQVGQGFQMVGQASDGVIEACEKVNAEDYIVGVQWHPEHMFQHDAIQMKLFEDLVGRSQSSK